MSTTNRKFSIIAGLASSLDKGAKFSALKRTALQVLADEGGGASGLKVFKHGDGAQFAYEMYKEYVSDGNFQHFPDFMQKLDQMVFEFRGNQPLELVEDDDDEEEDDYPSRKKGKKNKYKPVKKRPKAVAPIPSDDGTANSEPEEDNSVVVSSTIERLIKNRKPRR